MPCQSHFLFLTLHRPHLVRARAREVDDAAASIARSVVVSACSLLGGAKPPQTLQHTANSDARCKYSGSLSTNIKSDALVIRSRWKWAGAQHTLAGVAEQRHSLLLAPHSLHLVRARARKVHHAAASLAHGVIVCACSLFSGAKAAKLGPDTTGEGCSKHSRWANIRQTKYSLESVLHERASQRSKAADKEPKRSPQRHGSRRPAPTRQPRLAQRSLPAISYIAVSAQRRALSGGR